MGNQKTTKVKQQYYIPLEVKEGTIITKEYEEAPRTWSKIGNRRVRTILIPATEEQYKAYMQPEWKAWKKFWRRKNFWKPCTVNWPSWKNWIRPSCKWLSMEAVKPPSARKWAFPRKGSINGNIVSWNSSGNVWRTIGKGLSHPAGNFLAGFF